MLWAILAAEWIVGAVAAGLVDHYFIAAREVRRRPVVDALIVDVDGSGSNGAGGDLEGRLVDVEATDG